MTDNARQIIAACRPLIEEAERTGMWLHTSSHDLWFSPRQLREAQASGRFVWGPVNWELRDPAVMIAQAWQAAEKARVEYQRLVDMIAAEKTTETNQQDQT